MKTITYERAKNIILQYIKMDDANADLSYTATKKAYNDLRGKVDAKSSVKFNNWYKSLNLK